MISENEIRERYSSFTKKLIEKGLTITTMESATGGQIASLITDTEGSSAVLKGAFVTYCNEAKIMQGVPAETIERYSVYSEETAAAMADACARKYGADIGIGVTGTMGNTDPANPESSVPGRLFFAVYFKGTTSSFCTELPPAPSRLMYKLTAAERILEKLSEIIS
ncbi:MAG: CinA family protein [Oscillospiraceae bacterium]|nr:CinA family protein [Oscillospiraceae bacterium]